MWLLCKSEKNHIKRKRYHILMDLVSLHKTISCELLLVFKKMVVVCSICFMLMKAFTIAFYILTCFQEDNINSFPPRVLFPFGKFITPVLLVENGVTL